MLILAGGLLLLTPGLMTDLLGFSALMPLSRRLIKNYLKEVVGRRLRSGAIKAQYTMR